MVCLKIQHCIHCSWGCHVEMWALCSTGFDLLMEEGNPDIYGKCFHLKILTTNQKLIQCGPNKTSLLANRAESASYQCESSLKSPPSNAADCRLFK